MKTRKCPTGILGEKLITDIFHLETSEGTRHLIRMAATMMWPVKGVKRLVYMRLTQECGHILAIAKNRPFSKLFKSRAM